MKRMFSICMSMGIFIPIFASWTIQNSGTNTLLHDVDFVNPDYGWVVGGDVLGNQLGIILYTSDGGGNWINQTPDLPEGIKVLQSVSFVDTFTGWVVGQDTQDQALILKTTDGGQTWVRQNSPISELWPVSVHFLDENNGWMSQGGPYGPSYQQVILHTTDGGSSYSVQGWSNYDGGTSRLFFADSQKGFVAGGTEMTPTTRGYIMKTEDGGNSWWQSYNWGASIPWTWPLMSGVHFPVDNQNGWACGFLAAGPSNYEMRIIRTTNGGSSWQIVFSADTSVPAPWDIHFVDSQEGWVVCDGGVILHTTDGGNTWNFDTTGTTANLRGVDFVDPNNGWAVGSNGTILKWTRLKVLERVKLFVPEDNLLKIFPNPNKGNFEIVLSLKKEGEKEILLIDVTGRKQRIFKGFLHKGTNRLNLSIKKMGIYFVVFGNEKEKIVIK